MKVNVGTIDRGLRIGVGLAAMALGIFYETWWGALGLVPLITAFVRWCPAYSIFGVTSCGTEGCKAK
jgi:hypothetical protein